MDYALAPGRSSRRSSRRCGSGWRGYPAFDDGGELGHAYAGFAMRHFRHEVDPAWVLPTVDVTAGIRLALDVLSEPGPMVMPVPAYAPAAGRRPADRARARRPRARPGRRPGRDRPRPPGGAVRAGARTLLLTQPHNPWGRVFTRAELEGVRDVVVAARRPGGQRRDPRAAGAARRRARALPVPRRHRGPRGRARGREQGVQHRGPALRADHRARRAPPGRRCSTRPMAATTRGRPSASSPAVAAYTHGDPWLAALVERLDQQRTLLGRAARRAPAGGPDAAARGHLPRLARPAGVRPRRPGRGRARRAGGCGSRRATTTTPASTGTSG